MIEHKYCCGGGNAILKKKMGTVTADGITYEKGLFKCKCCMAPTIRFEEVGGQRCKVWPIDTQWEQRILNPQ